MGASKGPVKATGFRLTPPGQTLMLILIATVAILASLGIEEVLHQLRNTFEIVWPTPVIEPENALALDVAASMRRAA